MSTIIQNKSVPKIILNEKINLLSKTAISILVISNYNSFQVQFDKIASIYFMQKIYIYLHFRTGNGQPGNQHCANCISALSFPISIIYITTLHPLNGLFSRTTRVSQYQKGKSSPDLNEARDDGVYRWQWHQLDHMQTICTLLQTDNHTNTSSLNVFTFQMLFLMPDQQCQSTETVFVVKVK